MPLELGRRIDYIMVRSNDHGSTLEVANRHESSTNPPAESGPATTCVLADLTVQPEADSASEPRPASTERRITRTIVRAKSGISSLRKLCGLPG
jgi:hypothetical protein